MDPTTAAGIAVLVSKLGFFALLIHASRSATRAVRQAEAERTARGAAVPVQPPKRTSPRPPRRMADTGRAAGHG